MLYGATLENDSESIAICSDEDSDVCMCVCTHCSISFIGCFIGSSDQLSSGQKVMATVQWNEIHRFVLSLLLIVHKLFNVWSSSQMLNQNGNSFGCLLTGWILLSTLLSSFFF